MKGFKEFLAEAKTVDLDQIKDSKLNKLAWKLLKKGQKVYYSPSEKEVASWNDLKKEVPNVNDLFKYTDYMAVIAPGKQY